LRLYRVDPGKIELRALQAAGGSNLSIKLVALAAAFPNATEHADSAQMPDDVVDQFHDQDGFPHAGAAEEASFLTALNSSEALARPGKGSAELFRP
jgi:hypothetical protein